MFSISDDNYYSNEANWQFMSVSQYKDFLQCEAAAVAKLNGWQPSSDQTALYVGNYVHSYFESLETHEVFKDLNKERLFSSRKPYGLLKTYQVAENMIDALNRQKSFKTLYQGNKEAIVTGELYGVDWKAKIDCLNIEGGYFVDIKTTKGPMNRKIWNEKYGERVSWVADYGYILQMAVYQRLLELRYGKILTPIIAAVSKEDPPAFRLITLDEQMMLFEISQMAQNIDHISNVKNGVEAPTYCGECEYCRRNMQITEFVNSENL